LPGQFLGPSSVSVVSSEVTGSGEAWLVVGDSRNGRVQVLTLQGAVVHEAGRWRRTLEPIA
jgi:hypothetical protein